MVSQEKHVWQGPSGGHLGEYLMPSHILFLSGGCHPYTQPPVPDTKLPFSPPHPVHQIRRFCRLSPVHLHISDSPLLFTP